MELKELQTVLDADKWYESERAGKDACGSFPYCKRCDKSIAYPCASAYKAFYAKDEKPAVKKAPAKRAAKASAKARSAK